MMQWKKGGFSPMSTSSSWGSHNMLLCVEPMTVTPTSEFSWQQEQSEAWPETCLAQIPHESE
jgi:hypothetical protein